MKRVENFEALIELAFEKKSVMLPKRMSQRPWPAAFLINMQVYYVWQLLIEGVYIYEPKKKNEPRQT